MSYLLPTFVASIRSVGTACTMAGVGIYLHRRNFIVGEGKRTLALISQQVTIPAFLFTKIVYCNQDWSDLPCPDITNNLGDVWILLFWPAYVVLCGIVVGYVAARASRAKPEQYASCLAACAFGNSTGLPITLLTVIHANFSPRQELGAIDPTLFLSVYLLLYPVLQWALGGWLLAPTDDDAEHEAMKGISEKEDSIRSADGHVPHSIAVPDQSTPQTSERSAVHAMIPSFSSPVRNVLNNKSAQTFYKTLRRGISETDASLYISNADLVGLAAAHTEKEQELMVETLAAAALPPPPTDGIPPPPPLASPPPSSTDAGPAAMLMTAPPQHHHMRPIGEQTPLLNASLRSTQLSNAAAADADEEASSVGSRETAATAVTTKIDDTSLWDTLSEIFARCLQPPVVGAVLGLIVASTPIRGIFVDLVNRADAAPLEWMFDGLYSVGQAAVPINMIILGCNLSASTTLAKHAGNASNNLFSNRTMIAIVVGKMIVMPILGIISVWMLSLFWSVPDYIDEAFFLVCMIVFITPTANNVMVMVELSGSGTKEGIARVIGWQYAVAPIFLSLSVTATVGMAIQLNAT